MMMPDNNIAGRRLTVGRARWGRVPIVLAAACSIVAGACSQQDRREPSIESTTVRVHDATGRMVAIDTPVHRVISLAPSITEAMFAIGAGDLLVGRTSVCNYPPAARRLPVVADLGSADYEKIAALRPDLVLMTFVGNSQNTYRKLLDLRLAPYSVAAETVAGVLGAIDTIGMLTGHVRESSVLVTRLRRTIDSLASAARALPQVSVFVVLDKAPLMTVSRGFIGELLTLAGGRNIAGGDPAAYPRFAREAVLERDPDVIIIPEGLTTEAELVKLYPEWSRLSAVRNGRVHVLPPDIILRPGPRIGEALAMIFRALHAT